MDDSAPFSGSQKQRHVLDAIIAMIDANKLGVGDRLPPEIELARELGVGRSTVREALKLWQSMGIVTRNKGAGTVLAAPVSGGSMQIPLSIRLEGESLLRTLALRRPLEIEAVRLAAIHADARQRHAIGGLMLELMEVYGAGADWRAADAAFHAKIHEATGNPLFGQIIGQLQQAFGAVYEAPFGLPQLGHASIPLHRPLAEAIAAADPDTATALMTAIIDEVEQAARQTLKENANA